MGRIPAIAVPNMTSEDAPSNHIDTYKKFTKQQAKPNSNHSPTRVETL